MPVHLHARRPQRLDFRGEFRPVGPATPARYLVSSRAPGATARAGGQSVRGQLHVASGPSVAPICVL